MKLLIVTQVMDKNHPILGFFHRWVEEFAKDFDEIHVICLEKGECDLSRHVRVYSLGKEDGENNIKYVFRFYKYFGHVYFKKDIDFVFFHMGAVFTLFAIPFALLRHFKKVPFYWWKAHGYIGLRERVSLLFVDEVVTSTASGFQLNTKKRRVVGQAIDTSFFTPSKESSGKKRVLFVGRVMPVKHLEVFAEVAKQLIQKGYSFTIVGPVGDDSYMRTLQPLFQSAEVEYRGGLPYDELPDLYRQYDFFLNTSLTHSMDKTVLEAALCGCIPLTANRAFKELLQPYGLYFNDQDVDGYVEKIISTDTRTTIAVTQALQTDIRAQHSLHTFTQRIFDIV